MGEEKQQDEKESKFFPFTLVSDCRDSESGAYCFSHNCIVDHRNVVRKLKNVTKSLAWRIGAGDESADCDGVIVGFHKQEPPMRNWR